MYCAQKIRKINVASSYCNCLSTWQFPPGWLPIQANQCHSKSIQTPVNACQVSEINFSKHRLLGSCMYPSDLFTGACMHEAT